jgi:16S rRNA (guanine1516-N2)-methyltransferase
MIEYMGSERRKVMSEKVKLVFEHGSLWLKSDEMKMRGDFTAILPRLKQPNLSRELIVRAAKIKNDGREHIAIDATAGMGEDSLLLAAAGFNVILYENDPIIAALLEDSLKRAANEKYLDSIAARMRLVKEDSIKALNNLDIVPDVVYLDPMFPERSKSGLIKKKFQLLQQLENPCSNEEELLEAAIKSGPKKIVIKRPAKGAYLAGRKPDYSIEGKAIRYDVLVFAR